MDAIEAKILFRNLLNRIKQSEDGDYQLGGVVTKEEMAALRFALDTLSGASAVAAVLSPPATQVLLDAECIKAIEVATTAGAGHVKALVADTAVENADVAVAEVVAATPTMILREAPDLDLSVLSLPPPAGNVRVCLDFGTAMSKASLVEDDTGSGFEDVTVLNLGVPGDRACQFFCVQGR